MKLGTGVMILLLSAATPAAAENLFRGAAWPAMSADRRANAIGDLVTIVIFQAAESSNLQQNASRKKTDAGGRIDAGSLDEQASLEFGGGYSGRGEVRRSERLVAQLTATVSEVLPNGDLVIAGEQWLRVNGERTRIAVRGRVRTADIDARNAVLSSRIADAMIDYDGRGFVTRSSKPGLVNRIFSFLGLG